MDNTLSEEAWKDSFDKLLDERPILREFNVLKKDVRASFNMNSSYENSVGDKSIYSKQDWVNQSVQVQKTVKYSHRSLTHVQHHEVRTNIPLRNGKSKFMQPGFISTPIKSQYLSKPFKCVLSPIIPWELRHFKSESGSKQFIGRISKINKNIDTYNNIDCDISNEVPELQSGLKVDFPVAGKSEQNQKQVSFISEILDNNEEESFNDYEQGKENVGNHIGSGAILKSSFAKKHIGQRKSILMCQRSIETQSGLIATYSISCNDFKRQVLQCCGQRRVLTFEDVYGEEYLKNCLKIGEGVFGEVYIYTNPEALKDDPGNIKNTVLKVIPIEGKELVNGEVQKTFEQILPEIIISKELSSLRNEKMKRNATSGFVHLQMVRCIKGLYPTYLQKMWEEYDLKKESGNDHPKCFPSNQKYIILELEYSGLDLEAFCFKNAEQSFYALQQIILTLAVGENEYQFEHRDLHWGNVLVLNTSRCQISYMIDGQFFTLPTKGVQITIIDYTMSRMTFNNYNFYNDLSNDVELFAATGDYQFEIYRMVRSALKNKWDTFEPKTNILWVSYIISKLIEGVSYKNKNSRNHLYYMKKLKDLQTSILIYKSCMDYARNLFTLENYFQFSSHN